MPLIYKVGPSGGFGGSPFEAPPPDTGGQWRVREINLQAGARIDRLQFEWDSLLSGQIFDSPGFGGSGGTPDEFDIPENDFLVRIEGTIIPTPSDRLRSIRFFTLNGVSSPEFGGDPVVDARFIYQAPENFHIVGFFGQSGDELDALGVYLQVLPPRR